jgi:hypothetical protein
MVTRTLGVSSQITRALSAPAPLAEGRDHEPMHVRHGAMKPSATTHPPLPSRSLAKVAA